MEERKEHIAERRSGEREGRDKSSKGKARGSNSKEPSRQKAASKVGKEKREKRSSAGKGGRGDSSRAMDAAEEAAGAEERGEKVPQLTEQRDTGGLHASQAKIKVVGLNG